MDRSSSQQRPVRSATCIFSGLAAVFLSQVVTLHAFAASVEQGLLSFVPLWLTLHIGSTCCWGKLSDYVSQRSILYLHLAVVTSVLGLVVLMGWNIWTISLVAVTGNPVAAVQSMFLNLLPHLKPRLPASFPLLAYCSPSLIYGLTMQVNENFMWVTTVFLGLAVVAANLQSLPRSKNFPPSESQPPQISCTRREIAGILLALFLAMAACVQPSAELYHTTASMWMVLPGFVLIASIVIALWLSNSTNSFLLNFCYGIPLFIFFFLLFAAVGSGKHFDDLTKMAMFAGTALPIVYEILIRRYKPDRYGHMFGLAYLAFGGGIALSITICSYCPESTFNTLMLPILFLSTALALHRYLNIELDNGVGVTTPQR